MNDPGIQTVVLHVGGKIVEAEICPVCPGRMALYPRAAFNGHMERHDVGLHRRSYKWTQPGWMLAQARRAKAARSHKTNAREPS